MSSESLAAIQQRLKVSPSFVGIFGALGGSDLAACKRALDAAYRKLAFMTHPDQSPESHRDHATRVFQELGEAHRAATIALEQGTYEHERFVATATFTLASALGEYTLGTEPYAEGSFSTIFAGIGPDGRRILAKVARAPTDNPLLEHEAALARRFATEPSLRPAARFMPELKDTFLVPDGALQLRVSIYAHRTELRSLATILDAYPSGLPPEDAGWISRRVMAQALAAESVRMVHGAIIPAHVLVHPLAREPLHLGWAHAQPASIAARITHIVAEAKEFYPPEVFAKGVVDARTDIYMAGAVITKLFGGDVCGRSLPAHLPRSVRENILACLHESPARRPQGARAALDAITRSVRDAWGKTYRPLVLPVRS